MSLDNIQTDCPMLRECFPILSESYCSRFAAVAFPVGRHEWVKYRPEKFV